MLHVVRSGFRINLGTTSLQLRPEMASNRLPVFLLSTTTVDGVPYYPPDPPHHTSPRFAFTVVSSNWAAYLNPDQPSLGIVLLAKVSWTEIKNRFSKVTTVPQLPPPRLPQNLDLYYPEPRRESGRPAYPGFAAACRKARLECR